MQLTTVSHVGWLYAGFALLVWGVTFASTRALLFDFSALEIQVVRFALAWVALGVVEMAGHMRRGQSLRPTTDRCLRWRDERLFAAMGLTGVFAYQLLENCAIYYTNASNVAILVSIGPIVTAAFARIFTRDRSLSVAMVVGSLVAVVGVVLVSLNGALNFAMRPLGDLMAIGAMLCWGVYSVLIDRVNVRGIKPLTAIRKAFGWAILMMVPFVLWGATASGFYALDGSFSVCLSWTENCARFARPLNLFNLVFLGVLASALSFVAWSRACACLGVVRTTVCLYLEPVVAVGFVSLFLDERPTVMSLFGGVLIVIGVAVANRRKR